MTGTTASALMALGFGAALAVLLSVPFVAVQYRRHGKLGLGRTIVWFGSLVYFLALWTYTLLPLPAVNDFQCVGTQLTPFQFIDDIRMFGLGGIGVMLRNPAVMQVALNVLLFLPLGWFLRAFWRRGIVTAAVVGFVTSLLIETTQLTGVWGIYHCAYRVFDVDDLIANTAGALIGSIISWPFFRHQLGLRDPEANPALSGPVTFMRRLIGMLSDWLATGLIGAALVITARVLLSTVGGLSVEEIEALPVELIGLLIPFLIQAVVVLASGRTIGDAAVLIRYLPASGRVLRSRAMLRYLGGIGGFQILLFLDDEVAGLPLALAPLFALVSFVAVVLTKDRRGLPGLVSGTAPTGSR